jgi:hypothetical protein
MATVMNGSFALVYPAALCLAVGTHSERSEDAVAGGTDHDLNVFALP